jgi:hypothetical protein
VLGTIGSLVADSSETTGLKWQAPAGNSFVGVLARTTQGAGQTLANNTATAKVLGSEVYDTDGFHDNTTNNSRLTVPSGLGGKYLIYGIITYGPDAGGRRITSIRLNGSTTLGRSETNVGDATSYPAIPVIVIWDLVATDYVEIIAFQNSGGDNDLDDGSAAGYLGMVKLG